MNTLQLENNAPLKMFLKHFKAYGEDVHLMWDIKMPVQNDAALATVCVCVHIHVHVLENTARK